MSFKHSVRKVFKFYGKKYRISSASVELMDMLMQNIIHDFVKSGVSIATNSKRKTLSQTHLMAAIKTICGSDIAHHAKKEGQKFADNCRLDKRQHIFLHFSVVKSHVKKQLKKRGVRRMSRSGVWFLTGVMQYLIEDIVDYAFEITKKAGKKTLLPRYILKTIEKDSEYKRMFSDYDIKCTG